MKHIHFTADYDRVGTLSDLCPEPKLEECYFFQSCSPGHSRDTKEYTYKHTIETLCGHSLDTSGVPNKVVG